MLSRSIDAEGRLITKRLHVIHQRLPHFITALFGNITVLDTSLYTVDPEDASKTSFFKRTTTFAKTNVIGSNQIERWYAYNEGHHHTKTVNAINEIISGKLQPDYSVPAEGENPKAHDL